MDTTPISLLERLRRPEERLAWDRFVDLYTPVLFTWARRLGLQASDAADLVQEVFAILVRKLPQFQYDPHKSFRKWLHTITLNRWRDLCRQRALAAIPQSDGTLDALTVPSTAEHFVEAEYRQSLVSRALELMRKDFRPETWQACWEFVVNGKPAETIARELGISVNAVYLAKGRVLRRLRIELQGLFD